MFDPCLEHVHVSEQMGDVFIHRFVVNIRRGAGLQDTAVCAHHLDAVGHEHGLLRIVGDHEGGHVVPL